ncbi:hypothetical protein [Salinicola sp. RZ23]|uniref:hypothetical protein n=1 Tax=Salinicola sp. RZ23 TaxID=1949087 RepID=UPI000DA1EABE|nr:hypothetical protein [Salinicola sp. RZ23]
MPNSRHITFSADPDTHRVLEAVREQQGLETTDQAAEFLIRRRMRLMSQRAAGPRNLTPVRGRR